MLVNAVVVFGAPGSQRRYLAEQALRFPDFSMLDVSDKLAMGFGLVSESILDPHNLLVAAVVLMASALLVRAPIGKASTSRLFVVLGVLLLRSEEGRVGQECVGTCGYGWAQDH